jgi:hypothetical protein
MHPFPHLVQGPVLNYPDYIQWVTSNLAQQRTSGTDQSERMLEYTRLNLRRMQRIDKTLKVPESVVKTLSNLPESYQWWVITEAWCGDSAQVLPVIARMVAESAGRISLHILFRDKNPAIIDQYLTNGGRSVPKLVAFNAEGDARFTWGPRPATAHQLMMGWKAEPAGRSWEDIERELHTWYAHDKGQGTIAELIAALAGAE